MRSLSTRSRAAAPPPWRTAPDESADCGAGPGPACRRPDPAAGAARRTAVRPAAAPAPAAPDGACGPPRPCRNSCSMRRSKSSIWASSSAAHRHRQFGGGGGRGRAHVGGEIDQGGVGLMPHRRDQRNDAGGGGAHHRFVIEGHQVFHRAAAPRHDDQIGPRQMLPSKALKPAMAAAISAAAFSPCTATGHSSTRRGKRAIQPVHDVADHRAGGRGDHADHLRQERQLLLARGIEQAFGGQALLALLQQRHQRAQARQLHLLHDRSGSARSRHRWTACRCRPLPCPASGRTFRRGAVRPPDHGVQHRLVVLEVEIDMAGGMRISGPEISPRTRTKAKLVLHRALQGGGQFADRKFGQIGQWRSCCFAHGPV